MTEEIKPIEDMSFREAMAELDTIIAALESNTLELEESLDKYARGVTLLKSLKSRLGEAQQTVEVLMGELQDDVTSDEQQDTTLS